jgi:ABC-type protease/lipase transport system fused ATPase/permease subunit
MYKDIILQVQDLKKYFGQLHAVDGVNLSVSRGQVYGFLGPNGSGKTTTIGMILGLIHPTAGSITLFGEPVTPLKNKSLQRVGALVGTPSLVPFLSARLNWSRLLWNMYQLAIYCGWLTQPYPAMVCFKVNGCALFLTSICRDVLSPTCVFLLP